jgi:ribonuclease Z
MEDYISPVNPKQGFGHSTMEMAIETAKHANVSQLVLYHLDPSYDDNFIEKLEEKAKGMFTNSLFAYENLEIDLMQVKCKA